MKAEEKAQELYPNNSTFCGGVAQIARDAFIKGARLQKEADTLRWQDIKTIVEIDHELFGVDTDGLCDGPDCPEPHEIGEAIDVAIAILSGINKQEKPDKKEKTKKPEKTYYYGG